MPEGEAREVSMTAARSTGRRGNNVRAPCEFNPSYGLLFAPDSIWPG